jgi:hypothetical protein
LLLLVAVVRGKKQAVVAARAALELEHLFL